MALNPRDSGLLCPLGAGLLHSSRVGRCPGIPSLKLSCQWAEPPVKQGEDSLVTAFHTHQNVPRVPTSERPALCSPSFNQDARVLFPCRQMSAVLAGELSKGCFYFSQGGLGDT